MPCIISSFIMYIIVVNILRMRCGVSDWWYLGGCGSQISTSIVFVCSLSLAAGSGGVIAK